MSSAMESPGGGGGGVNKYLHKKFKKQTSIEATVCHVPSVPPPPPVVAVAPNADGYGEEQRLPQLPDAYRSTNSDITALKSSITYPTSFGPRRGGKAYSLDLVRPREEPAGTTATLLALRKVDSTSSEQSDEDISQGAAKIRRSPPKQPHHQHHQHQQQPHEQHHQLSSTAEERLLADDAHSASTSTATTNGGKYVCPFCSLACSKPSVLQKHIRAHTNERPYPCQSCNFSFKTRSNLYKHCRSRTHVNRVMGNKGGGGGGGAGSEGESNATSPPPPACQPQQLHQPERPSVIADAPREDAPKAKPYKPRFHTKSYYENENEENSLAISNEKNTEQPATLFYAAKIFNVCDQLLNSGSDDAPMPYNHIDQLSETCKINGEDQPLNLTSKSRKRCLSEVSSEPAKKSLIKELLLKNLSADTNLQCQHCKMIFRTFTELELHKMKMCKGRGGSRYNRSSSVNVASILTQNKNAFDNIPPMESVFSLKSPGPFLGKTRLVESDKSKSFSCEDGMQGSRDVVDRFNFYNDALRKPTVKLFGGEVKVTATTNQHDKEEMLTYPHSERSEKSDYHVSSKVSENRVIRNTLQSGGIVVHAMQDKQNSVIKSSEKVEPRSASESNGDYSNIMDFSQNAAKLLAPNLKQLNLAIPGTPTSTKFIESAKPSLLALSQSKPTPPVPKVISVGDTTDPMNLFVNGKVVRYVPGMPGPVIAETIKPKPIIQITPSGDDGGDRLTRIHLSVKHEAPSPPTTTTTTSGVKVELEPPPPVTPEAPRKFARPNSLALKPSATSLKHHHGLTPTMFNQILISPDTPRGDKKYNEQLMNGYYYSNLGLKSSTKPVYCTLNKTQPFYVPHFRKLSMYSEWRQQDNKGDKWFLRQYVSQPRDASFSIAGKYSADNVVHSSYKFIPGDVSNKKEEPTNTATAKPILGGYESHEEYTYVRGRGRGRYVCDQCGIRCTKPSILRKHILTHTNDRPFTCAECKYSFKTKGNLTKHMKSRAHSIAAGMRGVALLSGDTDTDDDDDDDSGMDSSDETSTRIQEHEAAYGLLSLSQKVNPAAKELPSPSTMETISRSFINAEQLAHVFNTNYVKNKILDQTISLSAIKLAGTAADADGKHPAATRPAEFRPLTYPYTTPITTSVLDEPAQSSTSSESASSDQSSEQNIIHFSVIKRYNRQSKAAPPERIKEQPVYHRVRKPISPVQVQEHVEPVPVVLPQPAQPAKEKRKQIVYPSLPPPPPAEGMQFMPTEESEAMDLSFHQEDEQNAKIGRPYMSFHPKDKTRIERDEKYRWRSNDSEHHHQQPLEEDGHQIGQIRGLPRNNIHPPNNVIQTDGLIKLREIHEREYDNSAMETLADIATKQEKLEKNSVAKNVATEFLKLATKNEASFKGEEKSSFGVPTSVVSAIKLASSAKSDLIVKSEENKNCMICNKTFNKPSQLRLHMNIHYLERPYRCDSCSVSFRTKGHLQKHERSAGHHNKLSSSPALLSQEPRPFKCVDCNIAFRIHGHLAKHLRSKMHILKLECLAKIPFGLYAELERSNSLLTEINTADGDQCLDSLKALARRIFSNDPGKLTQLSDVKSMEYQSEATAS